MAPKNSRKKPGSRTWVYRDKNGDEVATVHFKDDNGAPLAEPDPKTITVGNRRYIIHDERLKANPEERYFKSVKWRKRYGCFRKLRCCQTGPLVTVP